VANSEIGCEALLCHSCWSLLHCDSITLTVVVVTVLVIIVAVYVRMNVHSSRQPSFLTYFMLHFISARLRWPTAPYFHIFL